MPAADGIRRPVRAATVLAAVTAALAACGGSGRDPSRPAAGSTAERAVQPVGQAGGGSVAQLADCTNWRRGTVAERAATVRELRGQLTTQTSASAASPLADDRAYALLQKACSPVWAGSLRLYKLYVRAQGFAPLAG